MKAEDLMIGDLINGFGVVRRVTSINGLERPEDDGLLTTMVPGCEFPESNLSFRPCYAQPIPLTAEILEKNGFRKFDFEHIEGQHKWSWWRDTETFVSLWCRELNDDTADGWMVRIESSDATCCRRVESVHELQHALRLCGVEKEIIL